VSESPGSTSVSGCSADRLSEAGVGVGVWVSLSADRPLGESGEGAQPAITAPLTRADAVSMERRLSGDGVDTCLPLGWRVDRRFRRLLRNELRPW